MTTVYTYPDAYLDRFCTDEREARAIADIATYGTFPAAWTEKLVIVQTYILACLEHQGAEEDLFTSKLKTYRGEFARLLPLALKAAAEAEGEVSTGGIWSVPLERA